VWTATTRRRRGAGGSAIDAPTLAVTLYQGDTEFRAGGAHSAGWAKSAGAGSYVSGGGGAEAGSLSTDFHNHTTPASFEGSHTTTINGVLDESKETKTSGERQLTKTTTNRRPPYEEIFNCQDLWKP
jgi:hypothetical protein